MCVRYATVKIDNDLRGIYGVPGGGSTHWAGSASIAPSVQAPLVREYVTSVGAIERELSLAEWGLRFPWLTGSRERAYHNVPLETVAKASAFRNAFIRHRAIVPMDGYYEWEDQRGRKRPHFIRGAGVLSAAGLYEVRKDVDTGSWQVTYTIITRTARDASGELHHDMPVFLTDDVWTDWMSPADLGAGSRAGMLAMLRDVSATVAATLRTHPAPMRINNVGAANPTDPRPLEPVDSDYTVPAD